jgi:hypothetical protein
MNGEPFTPADLVVGYIGLLVLTAIVRAFTPRGGAAHRWLGYFLSFNGLLVYVLLKILKYVVIGIIGGLVFHSLRYGGLFNLRPTPPPYQTQYAPTLKRHDWQND